jgi:ribosomal protein L12E/L44/L45/RPP1/RPP2
MQRVAVCAVCFFSASERVCCCFVVGYSLFAAVCATAVRFCNMHPADRSVMTRCCCCLCDSLYEQGLVDAYVANSQQAKAVSYLTGLRDKILATAAAAAPAAAAAAGSSSEAAAADAASSSGDAAAAQASSSEQQQIEVDPIGVQLLLGEHTAVLATLSSAL